MSERKIELAGWFAVGFGYGVLYAVEKARQERRARLRIVVAEVEKTLAEHNASVDAAIRGVG